VALALTLMAGSSQAQIVASRTAGCGELVVNFRPQQPFDPANSYHWELGRGPVSTAYAPVGVYPSPGVYPVRLEVTLPGGHRTVHADTVRVFPRPDVRFTADDTAGCFPHPVRFTDASAIPSGGVAWREWFFGDGNRSLDAAPGHVYRNTGTGYSVTLRLAPAACPQDTFALTRSAYIRVFQGVTPDFDIPPPAVCRTPASFRLANRSTAGPGQTLSFQWTIPGASPAAATDREPTVSFPAGGDYTATLVARSDSGCVDTVRRSIRITPLAATSDFRTPADTVCQGALVDFLNRSTPGPDSSFWQFGTEAPVAGLNQYRVFTQTGDLRVRLVNRFGSCRDTVTRTLHVAAAPQFAVTGANRYGCRAPHTVDFTLTGPDVATLGGVRWDFGDGNTLAGAGPTARHTYARTGGFPLAVTLQNRYGCATRRIVDSFVVIAPPRIRPVKMVDSGCANLLFRPQVDIEAPDGVSDYAWTFGDGAAAATGPNPAYTYTQPRPAPYPVRLRILTRTGCVDSAAGQVLVGVPPGMADFDALPRDMCGGDTVRFTDRSTATGGITGRLWAFGDGGTSVEKNPAYVYQDTGRFSVKLTLFNNGCPSPVTARHDYIRIGGGIATFIYVADCSDRQQFRFVNTSRNGDSFEWDFGDNSPRVALRDPGVHRFPALGSYVVTLKVVSGSCTMYHRLNVKVFRETPAYTARSAFSANACRGTAVIFSTSGVDPDNIRSYAWDFGDGRFTPGTASASRVYPDTGVFRTRLRITDVYGCTDSTAIAPLVIGGPRAGFDAPVRQGCRGLEVDFRDTTRHDAATRITAREWTFGDGNRLSAAPDQLAVRHRYDQVGSFAVKLVVRDDRGCADSMSLNGYVTITQPRAAFQAPARQSCPGSPVAFLNESTLQGGVFSWDFGDGTRSSQENPAHAYARGGTYTVALTVRDFAGCLASDTQRAYILVDTPDAAFEPSDTFSRCPPLSPRFQFRGRYARDFAWEFGDGNRSSLPDPTQIYLFPGTYRTRLVVASPGGCRDTAVRDIRILGPSATVVMDNTQGCDTVRTTFRLLQPKDVDLVVWDLDDGSASTRTFTYTHVYRQPGFYTPRVILSNADGCQVAYPLRDTVKAFGVLPGFSRSRPLLCDSGGVDFRDTSRIVGQPAAWAWAFGDGAGSALRNPSHNYRSPGIYPVTLTVTTAEGCRRTLTLPEAVRIVRTPRGRILGDTTRCLDQPLNLRGEEVGTPRDTSVLTWAWDFGNGQTALTPTPMPQSYPAAGRYAVRLLLQNSSGCTDTLRLPVRIDPNPVLRLPPDTSLCQGDSIRLAAAGAERYRWLPPAPGIGCADCPVVTARPDTTTTYHVRGENGFGCAGTGSVRIEVVRPPRVVTAMTADTICIGESVRLHASGADQYRWSPPTGLDNPLTANPVATPSSTTVYVVTGTDRKNCFERTGSTRVVVYTYPTVHAGIDVGIRAGASTRLRPLASPDVTDYRWSPAAGLSCTNCPGPVAAPAQTTTYRLTVANPGGCTSSDEVKVVVRCESDNIYLPNTFSPNGDGVNDLFYPRGSGVRTVRALRIYNRWGELVFQRQQVNVNDPAAAWDGRYKGRALPPDVYVYYIDVVCDNQGMVTRKGDVALIR
jgi:gliding motility-associated-like protein